MTTTPKRGISWSSPRMRKAATGRAWRMGRELLPATTSRVHLTDGTPYSRTGRNVKALCGATVWPEEVPDSHPAPVCAECRRVKANQG